MREFLIFILQSSALGCCTAPTAASTPAGRRLGSGGAGQDASQRCPNLNIKRERGHGQPVC